MGLFQEIFSSIESEIRNYGDCRKLAEAEYRSTEKRLSDGILRKDVSTIRESMQANGGVKAEGGNLIHSPNYRFESEQYRDIQKRTRVFQLIQFQDGKEDFILRLTEEHEVRLANLRATYEVRTIPGMEQAFILLENELQSEGSFINQAMKPLPDDTGGDMIASLTRVTHKDHVFETAISGRLLEAVNRQAADKAWAIYHCLAYLLSGGQSLHTSYSKAVSMVGGDPEKLYLPLPCEISGPLRALSERIYRLSTIGSRPGMIDTSDDLNKWLSNKKKSLGGAKFNWDNTLKELDSLASSRIRCEILGGDLSFHEKAYKEKVAGHRSLIDSLLKRANRYQDTARHKTPKQRITRNG